MMRATMIVLLAALLAWPHDVGAQPNWRDVIAALPPLSSVVVQFRDGKKVTGTIVGVHDDGFELQRRTRYPEAARVIGYDEVAALERHRPGISSGAKATLAAASVLTTLAVLTVAWLSRLD